ncbi:conserved hypothetical protein [Ricinus communis]|uniref:Thionin-like protein 2 n=1 Tax=Ricinus communis TaxID=3988 RepID=B9T0B5_RICCO|nr:conserved hypothetical protein [Ricinus communis]
MAMKIKSIVTFLIFASMVMMMTCMNTSEAITCEDDCMFQCLQQTHASTYACGPACSFFCITLAGGGSENYGKMKTLGN